MEHKTDDLPGEYSVNDARNHKEIIALIKRISGQANFIGTPRIYVDIFDGDLAAAVWFNQVVYWDGKTTEPIGFYKTYAEWKKELGLSEFQIRRVANLCQIRGLVNITFRKVYGTPKNHYLVIWPALLKLLKVTLDKPDPLETEGSETKGSESEENQGSMEGVGTSPSLSIEETPTKNHTDKNKDSFLKIISSLAPSVFGADITKWWEVRRRLECDEISIVGNAAQKPDPSNPMQIVIGGLSAKPKGGQFTEAEIWEERFYKSFARLGLEIKFLAEPAYCFAQAEEVPA